MRTIPLRTALFRAGLTLPLLIAVSAAAPANADHRGSNPSQLDVEYEITELESPAGGASFAASINNRGWVAGDSSVPEEGVIHATLWRNGTATDLGTLGGPNSAVLWPNKNNRGLVVGVAETDDIDPNREQWSCSIFFGQVTENACVGFVWERGEMRPLDTFGGTHGFATGVNNRGQVVGWAETTERDPSCKGPEGRDQVLGFVGAMWDTRHGDRIHELPPLPGTGDSTSTGNAINDRGQVVGISGECDQAVGRFSARHMAMWEKGVPTEIESFGGKAWNTPMALNNSGVVVGFANAADTDPAGDFNGRPFVWTERDGIDDLGALDGDTQGQALGINNEDQIVGLSRGDNGDSAVTWLDGEIANLNTLAPDYPGHLANANDINDDGVITGTAISADTGEPVAFIATPAGRSS